MKFPPNLRVFGDTSYRGECPSETAEQITFFNWLRREFPDTLGRVAVHIKNEGKRNRNQVMFDKASGMTPGASDIIILNLVIEMKRRDHTLSTWQPGQQEFLLTAQSLGAFACVALGADAAKEAVRCYLNGA